MPDNRTAELPEIGSTWLAQDGRTMRVDGFRQPNVFGDVVADMSVLNPRKGMRKASQQAIRRFGKFLQRVQAP